MKADYTFYIVPFHFDKRCLKDTEWLPVTRWLWNSKGVGYPRILSVLWFIFQLIATTVIFCLDLIVVIIVFQFVFKILVIKWIVEPVSNGLKALLIPAAIIIVIWLLVLSIRMGFWS